MLRDIYSVKLLRGYMAAEGILRIGSLAVVAACAAGAAGEGKARTAVLLAVILLNAADIVFFRRHIYMPNLRLSELAERYRGHGDGGSAGDKDCEDNLIRRIEEIIDSLDTISIKQKNAEILMKNAEIHNLQDQINPHFLYNTLEMIRGEAMVNNDRKVAEMIASLAGYFRYNISRRESFVFLKDELKNSRNYFNIQKNRFRDKITYETVYHDTDEKTVGNCYIPKLILQPVIENAIYHGLELKMGRGEIRVHITATEDSLHIIVADDGLGMTPQQLERLNGGADERDGEEGRGHNGVAIRNIRNRLKLYWGDRAYLAAVSEEGMGTQIHMAMPLLYEKEDYMN